MADMVQLHFFFKLTFEIMGEVVHLHLKGIFQKQINSAW